MVTPFDENGEINYTVYEQLIEKQIAGGVSALVINGTTGEAPTLSDEEKENALRFAVGVAAKRLPIIAGSSTNNTAHAIALSKAAEEAGVDGLMLVTPYYNKATQSGLVAHFNAIANGTKLPVILYNVPSRTGMGITPATYVELAKTQNIVAVKEACGDISLIAQVLQAVNGNMAVYSGNDDQILPILALGGSGIVSVLSNITPGPVVDMCTQFAKGNNAEAARLQLEYLPLINQLFSEVNPIPIKAALNMLGYNVGGCRLPLTTATTATQEKLRMLLSEVHLLR